MRCQLSASDQSAPPHTCLWPKWQGHMTFHLLDAEPTCWLHKMFTGCKGTTYWVEIPQWTQDFISGLYLPADLGTFRDPQREVVSVATERQV